MSPNFALNANAFTSVNLRLFPGKQSFLISILFLFLFPPWCSGYHKCTTSFNKAWTQVLRRFKPCSRHVADSQWCGSLTTVPAGNKAKRFSSVNLIFASANISFRIKKQTKINTFKANVPFLNPLKTSGNQRFSDIFRVYRNGTSGGNGLIRNC